MTRADHARARAPVASCRCSAAERPPSREAGADGRRVLPRQPERERRPDPTPRARDFAVDPAHQRRARGVGRHRQDARAGRSLRQPAAGRRRSRATSWRSPSRARPPPRCASASSRRCATRRARRSSTAARWRELRDRLGRHRRSARSTRSACRCCASFRSRPTSIPGFSMADETEVPRLVDESLDRALRIFAAASRRTSDVALVLRAARRSARRAGLAALLEPPHRGAGRADRVPRARALAI